MRRNRWKRLQWAAVAVIALATAAGCAGRLLPHRMLRVRATPTDEAFVLLSYQTVGWVRVSDPTGYAIPYLDRYEETIDPTRAYREGRTLNVPFVFQQAELVWTSRQGGPVAVAWWNVSLLPWIVLAAAVFAARAVGAGYGGAAKAWAARRARRIERMYSTAERCPSCDYDVRHARDRCPECGRPFVRRTVVLPAIGATEETTREVAEPPGPAVV